MEIGLITIGKAFIIHDIETGNKDSTEHLGLGYLAAFLRQHDFCVTLLDVDEEQVLIDYINTKNPMMLGFTTTCATLSRVINIIGRVKTVNPELIIFLGGHMATFCTERVLRACPDADFAIRGEGELTLLDICSRVKSNTSIKDCLGISYLTPDGIVNNDSRYLIDDLDSLPFPARDQIEKADNVPFLRISGSRGCYGHCSFCSSFVSRLQKPVWRGRTIYNIVEEMKILVEKYNIHTFEIVDASFEDPPKSGKERLRNFAQEILNQNLKVSFYCCFRADGWSEEDNQLLELLEEAGLEKVFIGVESGVDKDLHLFNKIACTADNIRAIDLFKNRKHTNVTFGYIMFHPYNEYEELESSAGFLNASGISYDLRNYLTKLEVYPGTTMYNKLKREKLIEELDDFSDYFNYKFVNREVGEFAIKMHKILQLKSIFDYIDFDIRVFSFFSRVYKHDSFLSSSEKDQVDMTYQSFKNVRADIAKFNYEFFVDQLLLYRKNRSIDLDRAFNAVNQTLHKSMLFMRTEQLKLMRKIYKSMSGKKLLEHMV